ncbi:MAG TPA: Xaa-Pro peptidase family protein [Anaerolineae bacterium]|nr:Xaa-Pro peptidase family protein [Anaerolineae bacterium]
MTAAHGISPTRYRARLEATQAAVAAQGSAAMLVGVGPELEWLSGYAAHGIERLNLLVIPAHGPISYISPRLEASAALQAPGLPGDVVELRCWEETEDPFRLLPPLVGRTSGGGFLVSDGLRAAFLLRLQAVLPAAEWGVASAVLAPMRRVKDDEEVALLRAAAAAADRAIERIIAGPLIGRTEAEVARDVRDALVQEGHESAEFAIVASGPNSASPHHEPGGRRIGPGEPLLLDIGGRRAGYCSDITRTVWVAAEDGSAPDDGFVTIYELTSAAQAAARAAVRPGVTFDALDASARAIIAAGGFGDHFIHRLGHGIGLEVHEEPYLVSGNQATAVAGNTFSCEPGIYLEGRYGVRIEDAVVCTPEGGESLNAAPRALRVVAGR